ncbi:MAG: hypothetical protein Q8N15_07385, partial [Bacillota bacterium]|nr:hypothetical protein [Bacillota bacterium]
SAELILVKNEIVQVLLDTMPSVDDLALLYRMMLALSNPGGTGFAAGAELLANEFAIQSLYEIELSLRFLLSSEALFEELLAPRTIISPEGDPLAPARMIQALAIDYMAFKTANADLLAAADAALDDAVDYLLFRQSIALSNALLEQSGATADQIAATNVYYDAITPELFVKMNATDELLIDRVMAYIATCDENVLYLAAVARGISYDGETWHNHATLETYDSVTEYEYVYRMTNYALRAEYFAMIDATIGTLSVDEVADLLEVLAIVLPLYTTNLYPPEDAEDAQAILFAYQALFAEDAETAVALLQQTAAYVVDNDVYGGIAALFESVNQYWIDLYGEDYCAIEGMDRSYGRYRYMLYFARHYDALLTTETEAFLDQAIDVYYDFHRSAASPVPDAGDAYWDERQAISESHLADIVAGARACGDLDIEQLTEADEAALDAMFGALFGIFFLH